MNKPKKNMLSDADRKDLELAFGKETARELDWYFDHEVYQIYTVTEKLRNGEKVTDKQFDKVIEILDSVDHVLKYNELCALASLYGIIEV